MFIKPNIETISSTKATLKAKEKEYNEDVAKVARKEELRKQILDAYDEGKNMADMFFPELASYEADNEFRAFLSQCKSNVLVEDFEVSAPTTAGLSTNIFIPEEVQYDLKNYVNQGTNVDITKIDPNLIRQTTIQLTLGAPQTIGATTVTFTVKATSYEELLKFADEVNNYQKDENGNKIRKAIEISEVRFNDLLTLSEYEEKSAEILDEAEQAAVAIAKRDFARVMELDKKDVDSRYMYSIILIEESDLKAAKDVIDDMKFISPISAETVEVQARWNQASGKYKDAIKQYTLLLSKKERVDWIISRAECHLAVHNLTPAGNDINDALKIEPENAYLYLLKAKLNKFLYQNDESLKNLEKAVSYGISREYAEAFVSEAAQN